MPTMPPSQRACAESLGPGMGPMWRVTMPAVAANEALQSQFQPVPAGPKEHVRRLCGVLRGCFGQTFNLCAGSSILPAPTLP